MEVGVYHEFHCRPDETQAAAFAAGAGADRGRRPLGARRDLARRNPPAGAPLGDERADDRGERHRRPHQAHQDRHRGPGVAAVPPAAAGRGDRDGRPDQQRQADLRRRAQRQPAQLHGLWRALFGKPRAVSRNPGDRQAGMDPGAVLLRRQILAFRQCQRGAAALSEAVPADPRRRRQRGDVSVIGRGRLPDLCRGAQRLVVGSGAGSRRLSPGLQGRRPQGRGRSLSAADPAHRRHRPRGVRRRPKKASCAAIGP